RGSRVLVWPDGRWGVPTVPIAFSPDGRAILSDVAPGTLALTDVATGKEVRRFQFHPEKDGAVVVGAAQLTADGRTLLALGQKMAHQIGSDLKFDPPQPLQAWDVASGKTLLTRTVGTTMIGCAQ